MVLADSCTLLELDVVKILTTTWDWKPSVLLGCAVFLIYYLVLARSFRANWWQITSFTLGTLLMVFALVSPLDTVGDIYLFSVHMAQHLLLLLIVPPFWLWGLPPRLLNRVRTRLPLVARFEGVITQPFVAWIVGIGTVWLWHIPVLYEATLSNEVVHVVEHLTFLASGVVFWWAVMIVPAPNFKRIGPLFSILYLFMAAVASSILGIILTYAAPGLYPAYLHPADRFGILQTIRETWGVSVATDQQAGGLLMWVLGSPLYLLGCLGALGRWYKQSEAETAREIAAQLEAERTTQIKSVKIVSAK